MNKKIIFATLTILALCLILSLTIIKSEEIPSGATLLLETPSQAELEILSNPAISQDQYLINSNQYFYPSLNNPSNFVTWSDDYCNKAAGMDFIVEMAPDACQPSPVTSDLLEENDVPVMCKMTGIKINPLIDVPSIKNVRPIFKNQSKEIAYINFYPTRSAVGSYQFSTQSAVVTQGNPTLSNLGYIVVSLKQQPVESKMPNNVSVNVILNITYDVSKTYGLHTEQFFLPVMTQDEWENGYKKYSFGNGKGYVRVQEIKDNNAKISVYYSALGTPIASKEMREGDSLTFKLPGFYCQEGLNITLDKIKVPGTRARLIVNGDEFLVEEGEKIADSGCQVQSIKPEQYGYGGTVQITCQGSVYSGKGSGDYGLSLAPKHADLNIQHNIPTKGSKSEKEVTLGREIELNVSYNNEYKLDYYYVAHIGKAAASGKSAQDVVILFASRTRTQLDETTIRKYVQAFQKHLLDTNKPEIESDFTLKNNINKNPDVNGNIGYVIKIEKGIKKDLGGQQEDSSNIEVLSVEGPRQVTYSAEIETAYKSSIGQYRSISNEFLNQKDPAGVYYGIRSLRAAQELAHFMSKEDDEINFLQEIIDQYQDNQDEEVQYAVESARDDIVSISRGSGNKFTTLASQQGTYYVTLVSIDTPGYNSQEATLKVDGAQGNYLIGDIIGDWAISEIKETYVTFVTSGKEEPITTNSFKLLGTKKVQVISTYIKKEAKVTFWPFEKERTTTTNFSVVIGISKRSIQLTPDQIQKKIRDLNKTIETLDKYVNALEKITTTWKKACYVGGTVLWAKNLLEGFSGTPMARSIVMKAWTTKCASEEYRTQLGNNKLITISQCYLKNKGSINTDVSSVKSIINEANDFVKTVKSKSGVVISSGLLGLSKQISDEKFILEAKNLFSSDSKAKALLGDVNEDVTVSVPIGRLSKTQRDDIARKLEHSELKEEDITKEADKWNICGSGLNISETLKLPETKYPKEIKACIKAYIVYVPVHVRYVLENLDELADQGLVSVDDIKELYLILAINKKVNSDPKSISIVLRDYNNINVFAKFDNFENILIKKENRDTLSSKWGFEIQSSESESNKKTLTYNSIPTIDSSVWGKFSVSDSIIIGDKKYYNDEKGGKPYMVFSDSGRTIFAILEPVSGGSYNYIKAFRISEDSAGLFEIQEQKNNNGVVIRTKEEGLSDEEVGNLPRIIEQDMGKCGHAMAREDYQIRFWESGPYEGLIAYMPILRNEGWYYATKAYSGMENKLVAYKETGQVNEYWICNVGENGKAEFNFYSGAEGDDCGCTEISKTTSMDVPTDKKEFVNRLEKSGGCIQKALQSRQKKESPINAGDCGKPIIGKPPVNIPSTQCEEFMSPEDCSLMYNLCDPVICPPSRCNFGGRFPVENVIQTGIVGSLVLCSSNTDVVVPVCITGLYNGLDSLNNMVFKQYRQCLQKQIDTGQTTGLCDYWHSVYFCQILWNNLDPFIKAGIPLVTSSLTSGGGEYALFSDAFKRSEDSLTYFTQNYGSNAFTSFKERSVNETGANVCDRYLSIRYPTVAKFFDDMTKADSYYQLYASVDEVPMGGGSPESHYRVFYNIYAGRDQPLSYYVYLKKKVDPQRYSYELEKQPVRDAVGFLAIGQTVSDKKDIIAPSGYTEICININGKDECGFGTLSTSFAIKELQNVYLLDQIKKNIKTQKECQAGSATIIPTASLNIQSQLQEALQPEIYRRGIIRICASDNPSGTTDSTRYQRIGYCDNEKIGCWLDMNSVNDSISDLGIVKDIYQYAEKSTITYMLEKEGYDLPTTSQDKLLKIEQQIEEIQKKANALIESINQRFSSGNPAILNPSAANTGTTGNFIAPLTGMATTEGTSNDYTMHPTVDDLKVPSNINTVEIQNILNKYSPLLMDLTERIDPLVKELKAVSDKCISIEEKSRAQWDIAVLLDIKIRLKSQVEVALTNLAITQGGSCAGNGGDWFRGDTCLPGYKAITDANDALDHPGQICCAQILGKFEEFTQWYTDSLTILNQNEKTDAITIGEKEAISPGKGRVIKADNGLKLLGIGNREFIIQYADNLFIKYTVSGRVNINKVITKGKTINPKDKLFDFVSTNNFLAKATPGAQVTVTAYVNSERDPRNPLCFFTTEKLKEIKKANEGNSKINMPSESECKLDRQGIEVEGVLYGTTPMITAGECTQEVQKLMDAANYLEDKPAQWGQDGTVCPVKSPCCGSYTWNVYRIAKEQFDLFGVGWLRWGPQNIEDLSNKIVIEKGNFDPSKIMPGDIILYHENGADHISIVGTPTGDGKFYAIDYRKPRDDPTTTNLRYPDYLYQTGSGSGKGTYLEGFTRLYRVILACVQEYKFGGLIYSSIDFSRVAFLLPNPSANNEISYSDLTTPKKLYLTTFGEPGDIGTKGPMTLDTKTPNRDPTKVRVDYYAALRVKYTTEYPKDSWRGKEIKLVNPENGKSITVPLLDYGPSSTWIENAGAQIIDVSPKTAEALFGSSSFGWSDKKAVVVCWADDCTYLASSSALSPSSIEAQINDYLSKKSGYASVKLYSLKDNTQISVNENYLLHAMSTFKGPLAAFFYMGTPVSSWQEADSDIRLMLTESNNEATTRIFKRLSNNAQFSGKNIMGEFNQFLDENGMDKTFVQSWSFPDNGYTPPTYSNRQYCSTGTNQISLCNKATTANELATFYEKLYVGTIKWKGSSMTSQQKNKVMEMLKKESSYSRGFSNTNSFLIDGTGVFYTKTGSSDPGESPLVYNDAGIIKTNSGDYALAILTMNYATLSEAQTVLWDVAKIVSNGLGTSSPPSSGTQTPASSSTEFSGVTLVSNVNNGKFDSSNENNLVSFGDSVKVCAVLEQNSRLYSGLEVSSKNSAIISWSGTTPTFEWYKIEAYQSPSYSGAQTYYSLPAGGRGSKDEVVQYKQTKIAGNDWCINQKSIDSGAGTYWYRAKVTIGSNSLSSLGEPADSSDISALQSKLYQAKISKYTSRISTLLKPDSMENYAISPSVLRVSRKSNYDTETCPKYGYQSTDLRCKFISTLESFKNVPFIFGCTNYDCGSVVPEGSTCSPTAEHLADNFIGIDCINLMIAALTKTIPGKTYTFDDFDNFISEYGTPKNNVNKLPLNGILNTGFSFRKDEQVEIGDILFLYANGHYTHTFVIYNDADLNREFNSKDYAVYASNVCPGPNLLDPESTSPYSGKLCYAPFERYTTPMDSGLRYTMVKINDLG